MDHDGGKSLFLLLLMANAVLLMTEGVQISKAFSDFIRDIFVYPGEMLSHTEISTWCSSCEACPVGDVV